MSTDTSTTSPQPEPHRQQGSEPIVVDGISYIPSSVLLTGIPKITFKDNRAFGVVDPQGQSPRIYSPSSELGFYYNDTRYLATWEATFNGMSTVGLSRELRFGGGTVVFSMTNRDYPSLDGYGRIPRDTFLIRRILTLHKDTIFETLEVKNFDSKEHTLQIEQWAGGQFDDIFEVRGFPRQRRGKMQAVREWDRDEIRGTTLSYEGLDGYLRKTHIHRFFDSEKIRVSPTLIGTFTRVKVPPKGTVALKTVISFDEESDCEFFGKPFSKISVPEKMRLLYEATALHPFSGLTIETDNAILNRSIQNAQMDIGILMTEEPGGILYPYAGIPWFSAPFGRDGLITAYQMLPWFPKVARGVLDYAFSTLGTKVDPFTDEQPGKVFHEMRRGEMAMTREVPFIPYYGSVDSTPLALILLHEYVRWTMDLERLRHWWPSAMRALEWIEKWGDIDGDGFLEYAKQSPTGLVNQGWKDSHDSIMHKDGKLALAPIRLCEAQGYAYRARMAMATLAKLLGNTKLSAKLRLDALRLKALFTERFWDSDGQFVVLALDGDSKPCAVRSSNMGHCLWSQLLTHEQAQSVTGHLMSEAMFSGHGIRTLADTEIAYNPMSYHNGSIWPHDNSIILEGLRYYGHTSELERLSAAMIGVLESSDDFRLPELYCGFRKRGSEPPVPYEVACKPQAWAAGSVFLMLKAMTGLSMDSDQQHLVVNTPKLTHHVSWMKIAGLQGRDWEIDLVLRGGLHGTQVEVTRKSGPVQVLKVR